MRKEGGRGGEREAEGGRERANGREGRNWRVGKREGGTARGMEEDGRERY